MFSTETITLTDAVEGIRRIVLRDGRDHTATTIGHGSGCVYAEVNNGALVSVCIVGRFFGDRGALRALLVTAPILDNNYEPTQHGACIMEQEMWDNLADMGITVEPDARRFLRFAQEAQDGGAPWGEAFDSAVDQMREAVLSRAKRTEAALFDATRLAAGFAQVAAPATSEPLADWERELLAGADGVVRVEAGRIVRISDNPSTTSMPGDGYVDSRFNGSKALVTKVWGTDAQMVDLTLLDEDCQEVREGTYPVSNTIHIDHMTVIG